MKENRKIGAYKLKNGIRVMIVPLEGMRSVTVEAFVKIGAKYERKSECGLSHFLEHMAFKGTEKRLEASDINQEIDAKGANYNAGTSYEVTNYYITSVRENLAWVVELLADILFHSRYPSDEVVKEGGVIAEEIRMYKENPMMGLEGDFMKFMYGKSNIGCWDIAGREEEILAMRRDDIVSFRNRYFNPEEMVVVVAGDVGKMEEVKAILRYQFGGYENKLVQKLPKVEVVVNQDKIELRSKRELEQGHFILGWPSLPRQDKRRYQLRLLEVILAGNSSSRLYYLIREKMGWAYYVYLISEKMAEVGVTGIQSGVRLDKLDEVIELATKEIIGLARSVSEAELKRAKEYLRGRTGLLMDRSEFWSRYVGTRELLENRVTSVEEELAELDKVTLAQVKKLAGEIFVKGEERRLVISRKI